MYDVLLELLPILATVFLTITYVPQVVKTYKTKDVSGISLWFWILLTIALTLMTINAYMIFYSFGTYGYAVTETINLSLAIVVLIQVFIYRKKKTTHKGE